MKLKIATLTAALLLAVIATFATEPDPMGGIGDLHAADNPNTLVR